MQDPDPAAVRTLIQSARPAPRSTDQNPRKRRAETDSDDLEASFEASLEASSETPSKTPANNDADIVFSTTQSIVDGWAKSHSDATTRAAYGVLSCVLARVISESPRFHPLFPARRRVASKVEPDPDVVAFVAENARGLVDSLAGVDDSAPPSAETLDWLMALVDSVPTRATVVKWTKSLAPPADKEISIVAKLAAHMGVSLLRPVATPTPDSWHTVGGTWRTPKGDASDLQSSDAPSKVPADIAASLNRCVDAMHALTGVGPVVLRLSMFPVDPGAASMDADALDESMRNQYDAMEASVHVLRKKTTAASAAVSRDQDGPRNGKLLAAWGSALQDQCAAAQELARQITAALTAASEQCDRNTFNAIGVDLRTAIVDVPLGTKELTTVADNFAKHVAEYTDKLPPPPKAWTVFDKL